MPIRQLWPSGCSATHHGAGALGAVAALLLGISLLPAVAVRAGVTTAEALPDPCSGQNPIVCENRLPGTPRSVWDVTGIGDPTLQGFATTMSVQPGSRIGFKVRTDASAYDITIYRLGYYGGDGARLVDQLTPTAPLPQVQPPCLSQPGTGLVDCGTWSLSSEWTVPQSSVSGVYCARLTRADTGGASHILFVVRDDARASDILMQTSDMTWQAYNTFGGSSLYASASTRGRAVKVSYNRPLWTRGVASGRDSFFANEFPMVQFLEANGLDVTYQSGLDTARRPRLLASHRIFISVGHDEYWTGAQRTAVEQARDAGTSLAFFGGNAIYWRTRWEPSAFDDVAVPRTLVCFKESWDDGRSDPSSQWTGTWRDGSQGARRQSGVRPENALIGTAYKSNSGSFPLRVPAALGQLRFWRETEVARQMPGEVAHLGRSLVGYEFDEDLDNGWRPSGLIRLSLTEVAVDEYLVDDGSHVAPARAVHRMTMYRAPSGALVFSSGTVQWSWGLGMPHVGDPLAPGLLTTDAVPAIRQATLNVLADMGVIAPTPAQDLVATGPSDDVQEPTVEIDEPPPGSMARGPSVVLHGRARDIGGRVAAVEYSSDGGRTWHPAHGRGTWQARIALEGSGRRVILVRSVDDSLNISQAERVWIRATCPCSAMGTREPEIIRSRDLADHSAIEVGTAFSVTRRMQLSAIRFYVGPGNRSALKLRVWSPRGLLLWEHMVTDSRTPALARGWHTVPLSRQVNLIPKRRFIVSAVTRPGTYAVSENALNRGPLLRSPMRIIAGVFRYHADHVMPSATFAGSLYPIDPVVTDRGRSVSPRPSGPP